MRLPSTTALQVLLAIAERGSTSAATESVNLSQSAVSKQLIALESLVGSEIFWRTARGMIPTPEGLIYIEHARTVVKAMQDAALEVARMKPNPKVLRLKVLPILGDRWLLPRFEDFSSRHPDIEVQFTTAAASGSQVGTADGTFEFVARPSVGKLHSTYLLGATLCSSALPPIGKSWAAWKRSMTWLPGLCSRIRKRRCIGQILRKLMAM